MPAFYASSFPGSLNTNWYAVTSQWVNKQTFQECIYSIISCVQISKKYIHIVQFLVTFHLIQDLATCQFTTCKMLLFKFIFQPNAFCHLQDKFTYCYSSWNISLSELNATIFITDAPFVSTPGGGWRGKEVDRYCWIKGNNLNIRAGTHIRQHALKY